MNSHCHCCYPSEIADTGSSVLVEPCTATDVAVGSGTDPEAAAAYHVAEVAASPVLAAVCSVVVVDTDSATVSE